MAFESEDQLSCQTLVRTERRAVAVRLSQNLEGRRYSDLRSAGPPVTDPGELKNLVGPWSWANREHIRAALHPLLEQDRGVDAGHNRERTEDFIRAWLQSVQSEQTRVQDHRCGASQLGIYFAEDPDSRQEHRAQQSSDCLNLKQGGTRPQSLRNDDWI